MSMHAAASPCSSRALNDIATDWGYTGQINDAYTQRSLQQECVLGQGRIVTANLPCGIRFCASDLQAAHSHTRVADAGRSLMAFIVQDGHHLSWRYAGHAQQGKAQAGVLAIPDAVTLTDTQYAMQRRRCLVIQVTPESLCDPVLAQTVHEALAAPQAHPLPTCLVQQATLQDALNESHPAIALLLQESCALSLVAQGLRQLRGNACVLTSKGGLSPRDRQAMQRVRDVLIATPAHAHTLTGLAREAGVGVSTLKAKFPLLTGMSVFDFLRELRLELAYRGLKQDGWSVKQAAYLVGYRHPANFTQAFRRRYGVPPTHI